MRVMENSRFRPLLAACILVTCIGCDQATKGIATQTLRNVPPREYLNGTIRIEYALNPGGFLSLGRNLPREYRTAIFIAMNALLMLGLCVFLHTNRHLSISMYSAILFMIAGGVGNLIDRISNQGLVTDFINVGIGPLRTGVFNIADMAVTFGAIAVVYFSPTTTRPPSDTPDV